MMPKRIEVKSEVTGRVWKIEAKVGDMLHDEDTILILESMKMEIPVGAPGDCTLVEILVAEEEAVAEEQTLAIVEKR
jgi:acetyl-CoA carboxylase biotin carboxyl carrier protein